jgi:polyphenol oxidase
MTFKATAHGYEFQTPYALGFFSFSSTSWQNLPQTYPELTFDRVKQVHGDRLIESKQTVAYEEHGILEEADALFTKLPRRAVTVVSADCLPILILNPHAVLAIHAGWRGVKNEIILKSLHHLGPDYCGHEQTVALIGPHIQHQSFEVDKILADEFEQQYQVYRIAGSGANAAPAIISSHPTHPGEKAYINLQELAVQQLLLAGFSISRVHTLNLDTLTDKRFASYRRDKGKGEGDNVGRNFSFATRF